MKYLLLFLWFSWARPFAEHQPNAVIITGTCIGYHVTFFKNQNGQMMSNLDPFGKGPAQLIFSNSGKHVDFYINNKLLFSRECNSYSKTGGKAIEGFTSNGSGYYNGDINRSTRQVEIDTGDGAYRYIMENCNFN